MSPQPITLHRDFDLPWTSGAEQEHQYRRLLGRCTLALLVLSVVFSLLPVPERDSTVPEIPPRFARLLTEPPPPVVEPEIVEEPEPVEELEPEAEPEGPPTPEPEPVPEPEPAVAEEPVIEPEPPPPVDETRLARERASVAGLLPLAAELASLRDNDSIERLDETQIATRGDPEALAPERALLTANVGRDSGGIDTAALSRNTGGAGLGRRATTQVASPIAGSGGADGAGGAGGGSGDGTAGAGGDGSGVSNRGSRSREEIERVFDRNKGAIYALYNRALRQNPTLEGKLVLRLTIEPDGRVSFCEIVSSELNDPDLEQRLVQRVLLFEFEPKDVEAVTTTKPIDFFPA
jgi:protein TonB